MPNDTAVIIDCHGSNLGLFSAGGSVSIGSLSSITFRKCFLQPARHQLEGTAPKRHANSFLDRLQGPSTAAVVLDRSGVQLPCQVRTQHDYCSNNSKLIHS